MRISEGHVQSKVEGGVATVTFFHPQSNSLPGHVLHALAQAIEKAGQNPHVRVIVLRSDGEKVFCAGASFDELTAITDEAGGRAFFSGFAMVINAIRKAPVFVVGRIQGHCVGGGVGLAAAVDIALASAQASARLSELAIGIGPFVVGPAVERKVGIGAFSLMSATPATRRDAAWCEQHGLYAEVCTTTEALDTRLNELTRELTGYGPEAMAELKRAMWHGTDHWDELLAERAAISGRLVLSPHTREAIARFKSQTARR